MTCHATLVYVAYCHDDSDIPGDEGAVDAAKTVTDHLYALHI